jgi:hypothetical protein
MTKVLAEVKLWDDLLPRVILNYCQSSPGIRDFQADLELVVPFLVIGIPWRVSKSAGIALRPSSRCLAGYL